MRTLKWWVLFVVAIWFAGEAVAQNPQGKQKNSGINKNGGPVGQIQKGTAGKTVPGKKAKLAGKANPANQGNLKKTTAQWGCRQPAVARRDSFWRWRRRRDDHRISGYRSGS